jgi:hypothetical protein
MWENLTKHIKKVIMTSKNGHFELIRKDGKTLYRNGREKSDKALDYLTFAPKTPINYVSNPVSN